MSIQYNPLPEIQLGLSVKNIFPWYKRKHSSKSAQSLSDSSELSIPLNTIMGISWNNNWGKMSLDSEWYSGHYGGRSRKVIDFWFLRGGWEYPYTDLIDLRCGIFIPIHFETSTLGKLTLPSPKFDASLGVGFHWKEYSLDMALYGDAGQSYVDQDIRLGFMTSLSYEW